MLLCAVLDGPERSTKGTPSYPALEEREEGKGHADHTTGGEVRVLPECCLYVEKDLLDAGDGQLGLELWWVGCDLGEGLEDRSA